MFRRFILGISPEIPFQHRPVKNIDAHGSQIAFGLLRFFLEFCNAHVVIGDHDAKAARFIPGHTDGADGDLCLMFLMEIQHFGIIHGINVVTRQD